MIPLEKKKNKIYKQYMLFFYALMETLKIIIIIITVPATTEMSMLEYRSTNKSTVFLKAFGFKSNVVIS
jgi:hypothetical protein